MATETAIPGSEDIVIDPNDTRDTNEALDTLLKEANGDDESSPNAEETAAAEAKAAEEKAAAEAKAAEEKAAAEAKAAGGDQNPAPTPEEVAKAEEAAKAAQKDELDSVELPPHVKPKTVEAWSKLKETAKRKIAELSTAAEAAKAEADAARKERDELKQGALSSEEQKELQELREFRQKLDVEADPSFREYDSKITENVEAIYSRLTRAGFSKESIDKIKALGGPDKVNWEPHREKLPAELFRYLDAKLVENEDLVEKKGLAITKAKERSSEFLKNRQVEISKSGKEFTSQVHKEFEALSPKLPWLKAVEIPKDAKPEVRAKLEAANKAVSEIQTDLKEAIEDNSPAMRAVLVAAYASMLKLQGDAKTRDGAHKAEVDGLKAEITKLQAAVKEKEAFIGKIKGASTGRLSNSSAPDGKSKTERNGKPGDPDESGASALDRLRAEVEASSKDE